MTWSSENPSKPGWYWWRDKGMFPRIRLIQKDRDSRLFTDTNVYAKFEKGQWAGPIPEPEEP